MEQIIKVKRFAERFFGSPLFDLILFSLGVFITFCGFEVKGALLFLGIICFELLLCRDTSVTLLPFLLLCTFVSVCYGSYSTFIVFAPLAVPTVLILIFHFVFYKKRFSVGKSFLPLCAVSVAVTLGGLFTVSAKDYFSPTALFYTFGLGIGMVLVYLLLRCRYTPDRQKRHFENSVSASLLPITGSGTSSSERPRNEDSASDSFSGAEKGVFSENSESADGTFAVAETEKERLSKTLTKSFYLMGLLMCFVILGAYVRDFSEFIETKTFLSIPSRNNFATFIMFALPFPFYCTMNTAEKQNGGNDKFATLVRYSDLHLLSALFMYICLLLANSRGGLIFGTVEFVLCMTVTVYMRGGARRLTYFLILIATVVLFVEFSDVLLDLYASRTKNGLINTDEARYDLVLRAVEDFKRNKIFGSGLGYKGNEDIYDPQKGAMNWYHVYPAQIIGSFGILGIICFGYMIINRFYLFLHKPNTWKLTLGLSYLGILMMSMVNPGEFCPIPYEIMTVLLFIYLENEDSYGNTV